MKKDSRKKYIIIASLIVILIVVILLIILNDKDSEKVFVGHDYITLKEVEGVTDESKSKIPIINLVGEDIDIANAEIIQKYYSILYNPDDLFEYEVNSYKDILSLLITITYIDDSEYGTIEYYSYNINTKTNQLLNNKELYDYLNIDSNVINANVNRKLKDYYNKDALKQDITYEEYLEIINYTESKNVFFVKNNKLYCYNVIGVTPSLIEYTGNTNILASIDLK